MTGRAKTVGQAIAVAAVVGLLALLVWKVVFGSSGGAAAALSQGKSPVAPPFDLPRVDGPGRLSLVSLRGKPVVLNFWASWCIPCKQEAPVLEREWREHRGQGVVFLGVDAQDFLQDARRFERRYGITYPSVYDGRGSTLGRYGVTGFPETYFVDRQGRLVGERVVGPISSSDNLEVFERSLALLLGAR